MEENNFVQLNDKYRITSDGKLNIILEESYEKRSGAGKNAPLSGEIGFQTVGYFGAGLKSLIRRFNHNEFLEVFEEVQKGQDLITALEDMKKYLEEREQRIYEHVNKHVSLELRNSKEGSQLEK